MAILNNLFGRSFLVLAFGLLIVNSMVGYGAITRLLDATNLVRHTMQVQKSLNSVQSIILDSEASVRGFVISSDQRFLASYHQSTLSFDQQLDVLSKLVSENPRQADQLKQLKSLVTAKFAVLDKVLDVFSKEGLESHQRQGLAEESRRLMDKIRSIIDLMEKDESQLLEERNQAYDITQRAMYITFFSIITISVLVMIVLHVTMRRDIAERAQARDEIANYAKTLNANVKLLERERNEIKQLNEMGNFLQSCNSIDEVRELAGPVLKGLFPGVSGALSLFAASRNQVVLLSSWGDESFPHTLGPDECWGLRRGGIHHFTMDGSTPRCSHIAGTSTATETLCLPLVAHGDTLGLLTLAATSNTSEAKTDPDAATPDMETHRRLGNLVVRKLGLTLANLRLRESLNDQSIRDALTGTFNRRYLEVIGEKEIAQSQRFKRPLSVVMLDIDHFKRFNDLHGHSAGDMALIGVCDYLKKNIRDCDWMFRFGGEEFVILLRESGHQDAEAKARELCAGVASLTLQSGNNALPRVTISMGIATFGHHGETLNTLLAKADKALYESKNAGRNRVTLAAVA